MSRPVRMLKLPGVDWNKYAPAVYRNEKEMKMRTLELYLHIPFCAKKCGYCDFLSAPAGRREQESYIRALENEILQFPDKGSYEISTVFFGGGTPSLLLSEQIVRLTELLRQEFRFADDLEATIECNPGTADEEKLRAYRTAGINRLSIGLQSADDGELRTLGRIHTWERFRETYEAARRAGFSNINIDLMSALPGQTAASWERTLEKVLALEPEHISAYSLIIEEGTPFYEKYRADAQIREQGGQPKYLPSEEDERRMYERTEELLDAAGLRRYEISNYARPGYECRHNLGYWTGTEYAGFGLGAASLLQRSGCSRQDQSAGHPEQTVYIRRQNPADMAAYLAGDFSGAKITQLSVSDRMEEFMFLGLRLTQGVSEKEFFRRFGRTMEEIYGAVLREQTVLGLLERRNGQVFLTPRGRDLSNRVMAEFLL